jgi:hypothetical protein
MAEKVKEDMVHYSNPMDDATDDEEGKDVAPATDSTATEEPTTTDDSVLEALVEQELERQNELQARKESGAPASVESPLAALIVYGILPVFAALLIGLLVGNLVTADWNKVEEYLFGWAAIMGMCSMSYVGCLYIIAMYWMHPEKTSERRQLMAYSSWAGLVHYACILFESIDIFSEEPDGCIQAITMLDGTSFLMQMTWQVAVAHSVFRYIQFEAPAMTIEQEKLRHMICWGTPMIFSILMLIFDFASLDEYGFDEDVWTGKTLSPWCAVSGSARVRGAKAVCVHGPHLIGAVMYGFFYFYIAQGNTKEQDLKDLMGDAEQNKQKAALKKSGTNDENEYQGRNSERITASPHQVLLEASESKRSIDLARAATTLRHCMVAFVMAYLLATLIIIYTEHFHGSHTDLGARFCYMARIYLVAPQQLLYALFFAEGTLCGCFKKSEGEDLDQYDAPTATIKEGGVVVADVNTKVNAIVLDAQVKSSQTQIVVKSKSKGRLKKVLRKLLQAFLFVPIAFFAWMPIPFIYDNYTRKLNRGLTMAVVWVLIMMFPFVYFQGTRDTKEEANKSIAVIELYLIFCVTAGLVGVYRIRNDPGLLVVYNPHDKIIWNKFINMFRNCVAYGALGIEFFQIPMLAFSAAQLGTRYGTQFKPKEYDMLGLDEWLIDQTVRWTFDDLFLIQYPLAVLGVIGWILIYAVTNSFEMTFFRSINTVIPVDLTQVCLFGLAGPGFIFITKNLMKPLFCVSTVGDCGTLDCIKPKYQWMYEENATHYNTTVTEVLMAHRDIPCWSERHMTYMSISLSALCVFMPTATLTKAQFYLPSENIRFVYYFQRIEVAMKGVMVYLALSYKTYSVLALILLIFSSFVICVVVRVMQPSNFGHINRLKYLIHACSVFMCLSCLWAIAVDNKDRVLHAVILFVGWVLCFVGYTVLEKTIYRFEKQYLQQEITPAAITRVTEEIKVLQERVTSPLTIFGKRVSWGTHADILQLLQIAKHDNMQIRKLAFESMSVLAYLDQLTKKSSFSAYTASTCIEIFCKAIDQEEDAEVRAWAIRILKTFLQQDRYVAEMAELLDNDKENGLKIAEAMASIMIHGTQLTAQIDAGICLAEVCAIDSNQLKWVVPLLPILNEWILTGSIVAQHLALDLVSMLASRFDHAHTIVTNNCIPAIFELFSAIDETATSAADLKENPSSGFRKGYVQPTNISHVAHQLPRNVMRDFAAQFRNSRGLLAALGEIVVANPGAEDTTNDEPALITQDDFSAWMEAGHTLAEQIKVKISEGTLSGVDPTAPVEGEAAAETPSDNITQAQLEQLFTIVCAKGSAQDEGQIAGRLSELGLGDRGEIEQALKESGLRPKGISEMSSSDESILPARFAEWLRLGEKQDGIAKTTIQKCFAGAESDHLSDEMIDELFQYLDEEGAGFLTIDTIAMFLEAEGVGSKDDVYDLVKNEMVGRAVTDIMVQLSAKHVSTMKNEMVRSVLNIVMECGHGMSGLARQKMIEHNVLGIMRWALQGEAPTLLREVALQGLHALLGDCFCMDDVMADPEYKGYYADCLQLIDETKSSVERNIAKRKAEQAAAKQGNKKQSKKKKKKKKGDATEEEQVEQLPAGPDTDKPVLVFEHLTAQQRRKVHLVAQFGNLEHISSGPSEARIVEVKPVQSDAEFLKQHAGTPRKRLQSFGPAVVEAPTKIEEPSPPKQEEQPKHTKKRRWKRGGKRKKRPEPPPVVVEAPGVDPWAQEHYDTNREMLAEAGVAELLCDVIADNNLESRVTFYALDAVLLLIEHEAVPAPQIQRVFDLCCNTLHHNDIGVAVMAGFNLGGIIESKKHLFEEPATAMARFRRAARMIILQLRFVDGVRREGLDAALQRSRNALR